MKVEKTAYLDADEGKLLINTSGLGSSFFEGGLVKRDIETVHNALCNKESALDEQLREIAEARKCLERLKMAL